MKLRRLLGLLFILLFFSGGSVFAAGEKVTQLPSAFPTTDTTYYGRWVANPADIVFDANGGTGGLTISGLTGEPVGVTTLPTPTRDGFSFGGWYADSGFTGDVLASMPVTHPVGGVTYYAKWDITTVQVTFNSDGGSAVTSLVVNPGETISEPTTPTKSGFVFEGWYKDPGLTDDWNFASDTVDSATTLYAKWTDWGPYAVALNSDFKWVADTGGYPAAGQTGNGYYNYTGTDDYVLIPKSINGTVLTSYYKMFSSCPVSVKGVANQTDQIVNMSYMFYSSLATTLDLSNFNTSNVTNMSLMFYASAATTLDVSNFNTSNVTNMTHMFAGSQATTLNLSTFDTANVTNMTFMFDASAATTLNLSSFDTANVTNMADMFNGSAATTLNLSSFDTSNVTAMYRMFYNSAATTLNLSSFDTSNVTDMSQMFYNSQATTLDLSSFNTANVTNMSEMFNQSVATTIDLSSFDTTKVTNMANMFASAVATTGYARTTTDATKLNASSGKPAGLTFVVPAVLPTQPSSPPAAGTPISYSWDEIKLISESGNANKYLTVGQTKDMTLSTGEVLTMQIYGFAHDDKADGSGKAGITFGLKGPIVDSHFMNPSNINQYGWDGSDMRAYLNGVTTTNQNTSYATTSIYSKLPADLKAAITPVKKYTSGGYYAPALVTSTDNLFLFSEEEVGFTNPAYSTSGEGTQYPIFTDNASRIKRYPTISAGWWLRSATSTSNYYFLGVYIDGTLSYNSADNYNGVAFGFAI